MNKNIKVLYVDDEINNLSSFKASFRFDYKIFIAQTPDEALTVLNQNPDINVVLCDQRMPVTTGVDLIDIRQLLDNIGKPHFSELNLSTLHAMVIVRVFYKAIEL